ncbi:MAG TPA: hypothetical protein VLI68_04655 [Hanamia sp.]|jgi:hypothetical protein|nr:hypothetical protein [Hanamia sp.]
MKITPKMLALCLILITSYAANAQVLTSNRQNYFNKYSEKLPTATSELDKAFTTPEGGKVKLNFGDFTFNGIVTSSIKRYDNLYSVIIKAPGLNNTLLALSKRINDDKTVSYVGRIINENYADGFELRKENTGYAMNKIRTDALIEDY